MVKVGFETILYGRRCGDIERALDEIASAGFQGVEFAQSPAMLRRDGVPDIQTLLELLQARKLELIALAGGTLTERMDFCEDPSLVNHLYVEDEEPAFQEAWRKGFRLALHPHLFMRVHRMAEARAVLNKPENAALLFLPDTAHLTLSGDDPAAAIKEFANRLAGVHLKDWVRQFGRYSHRYARGFVELGQGIVEWDRVLPQIYEAARKRPVGDPLWLTLELDSTRTSNWASLCECARWLHQKRSDWIKPPEAEIRCYPKSKALKIEQRSVKSLIPTEKELAFRRRLTVASTKSSFTFYQEAAAAYHEILHCHLAQIWIFTPSEDRLDLVGRHGDCAVSKLSNLDCRKSHPERPLCAQVIDVLEPRAFNLRDHAMGFRDKELLDYLLLSTATNPGEPVAMFSVPISNTWNSHHIRFVVNLFPNDGMPDGSPLEPDWFTQKGFAAPGSRLDQFLEELGQLSQALSPEADSMLDERALAATGRIQSYRPGLKAGRDDFTRFFVQAARESLDAEAAAVFLVDPRNDRLEWRASAPKTTMWHPGLAPGDCFYFRHEHESNTSLAWTEGEIRFQATENRQMKSWKSREPVEHADRDDCIFAPILSSRRNEVMGVVRCTNKGSDATPQGQAGKASRMFTDDDAAVLDAIIQVASPIFGQLEVQEEQIANLGKIVHEFQVPLVAIRGAVDLIRASCEQKNTTPTRLFGEDYVEDIFQWTELVGRLVNQADVFRQTYQGALPLKQTVCQLMADIVVPAVRQVDRLMVERGFSPQSINFGPFMGIPRLRLDRTQMQQVIFNLLANSIKYAENKTDFRVLISSHRLEGAIFLRFEDSGPGIDEKYKEDIFRAGFRGPGSHERHVGGQGHGLSVVKAVLEAHGGTVRTVKPRKNFIIDLKLPGSLAVLD